MNGHCSCCCHLVFELRLHHSKQLISRISISIEFPWNEECPHIQSNIKTTATKKKQLSGMYHKVYNSHWSHRHFYPPNNIDIRTFEIPSFNAWAYGSLLFSFLLQNSLKAIWNRLIEFHISHVSICFHDFDSVCMCNALIGLWSTKSIT